MSFKEKPNQSTSIIARRWKIYFSLVLATTVPFFLDTSASAQPSPDEGTTGEQTPSTKNIIYVNSWTGNDQIGQGNQRSPFKTITHALKVAQPKTVILLAPGIYDTQTGEKFPLLLKSDVTIEGNAGKLGKDIIIEGSGFFLSPTGTRQNATIVATKQAGGVKGVTVTNPDGRGYGLWIESASPNVSNNTFSRNGNGGVSVNGNSAPTIANNYFYDNGGNGLLIYGTSRPQVRNNIFEKTGFGVSVIENSAPVLSGNRLNGNDIGIILQGNSQAVLRNNTIENSTEYGLVAIAQSNPDLGTRTEPGANIFRSNNRLDIQNLTENQIIPAFGNHISGSIEGKIDLTGTSIPLNLSASSPSRLPTQSPKEASSANGSTQIPLLPMTDNSRPLPSSSNSVSNSNPLAPLNSIPQSSNQTQAKKIPYVGGNNNPQPSSLNPNPPSSNRSTPPQTSIPQWSNESNENGSIEIFVPPPENNYTSQPRRARRRTSSRRRSLSEILVVTPRPLPRVNRFSTSNRNVLSVANLPLSNSNLGNLRRERESIKAEIPLQARYRVMVETQNINQEVNVRSVFPAAFSTVYNGQSMLQVGAYSNRDNAEIILQTLDNLGLNGQIVQF
ncbi:MAG: DUF1565 domain-containing protein [Moorea sp. SIO2B7]|nr:DUF1565 domain-containing protein [Moorena sp. SIO2B7]